MLSWFAQNTITAALLAALVAAGCRLFRFRPAVAHALWLVVLVKLLTPPLVYWPWHLPDWPADPPTAQRTATQPQPTQPQLIPGDQLDVVSDWSTAPAPPGALDAAPWIEIDSQWQQPTPESASNRAALQREPLEAATLEELAKPAGGLRTDLVFHWLFALWTAGTVAVVALQLQRIGRLLRMARGKPPAPALLAALAQVAARLQVCPPQVVVTHLPNAPLIVALLRPKLLWPTGLERRLPPAALEGVLAHELAHLRRRDHWVGWLELAAACLWWWNPLFWFVRHRLREAAELACDAWVVHALPGGRRSYAEALIEVCRFVSRPVTPLPAVGMGNTARRSLERRLTMILRDRVPCRVPLAGFAVIALLWLAALPAWSTGQEADKPATDPAVVPAEAPKSDSELAPSVAPEQPASQTPDRSDPFVAPVPDASASPTTPPIGQIRSTNAPPLGITPPMGPPIGAQRARRDAQNDAADVIPRILQIAESMDDEVAKSVLLMNVVRAQVNRGDVDAALETARRFSDQAALTKALEYVLQNLSHRSTTASSRRADRSARQTPSRPESPFQVAPPAVIVNGTEQAPAARPPRAASPPRPDAAVSVRTLSRATYRLPEAKANALAELLSEHVKDVETKVDGDTLIVTASPKAQQVIGQFIALLAGEQFSYAYPSPGEADALGSLGFRPPSPPRRDRTIHLGSVPGSRVEVALAGGQQQTFVFPSKIKSIDYSNADAVEVKEHSPTQLTVAGKRPGRWQITVRDQNQVYTLSVFTPAPADVAKPDSPAGGIAF